MVIFPKTTFIKVNDVLDDCGGAFDLQHLVHLFLIARDHKACAAMLQHIGHLFDHRVLVQGYGNGADALHGDHRPIQRWTIAPDDRHVIPRRHAKRQQPER